MQRGGGVRWSRRHAIFNSWVGNPPSAPISFSTALIAA
jgi:hypothetical protein